MERTERFWVRRLRWRLRGAWQWPAFALATFADGLILHLLPPSRTGLSLPFGLIVASFANLFLVGAVAPWVARRLELRAGPRGPSAPGAHTAGAVGRGARAGMPATSSVHTPTPSAAAPSGPSAAPAGPPAARLEVLVDRIATALLAAGLLGVLAAGLASRPLIVSETEATEENARLVRDYVLTRGTAEMKRNVDTANTIRLEEGYFRTCVSADDRRRAMCLFVDTRPEPPMVKPDPSQVPNGLLIRGD